ncbi:hypothetical protein [Streptomyces sp. SAS_272]|uniref:hypothetical protein n=1 Tax=Streptomyces sp. SAS_272 TaxID=3412747 RepID=UPI00403CFC94
MHFPTTAELRAASTGRLFAPYTACVQALADAAEREAFDLQYKHLAQALQIDEEKAAKALADVRAAAAGWLLPEAHIYEEARRCLHDHVHGLPYIPFLPVPSGFFARP